jgi:osmotically inducible lipoprotein OsmB
VNGYGEIGFAIRSDNNQEESEEDHMKPTALIVLGVFLVSLVGCSGLSAREQRVLSGGGIGAGTGAAISIIAGAPIAAGAAIGAAAGAVGGLIYDETQRSGIRQPNNR